MYCHQRARACTHCFVHPLHTAFARLPSAVLLDMYAPIIGQSRVVDDMLGKIAVKASDEAALGEVLMGLNGQLELLMAGGSHT